jgi:hypothetical protein
MYYTYKFQLFIMKDIPYFFVYNVILYCDKKNSLKLLHTCKEMHDYIRIFFLIHEMDYCQIIPSLKVLKRRLLFDNNLKKKLETRMREVENSWPVFPCDRDKEMINIKYRIDQWELKIQDLKEKINIEIENSNYVPLIKKLYYNVNYKVQLPLNLTHLIVDCDVEIKLNVPKSVTYFIIKTFNPTHEILEMYPDEILQKKLNN